MTSAYIIHGYNIYKYKHPRSTSHNTNIFIRNFFPYHFMNIVNITLLHYLCYFIITF